MLLSIFRNPCILVSLLVGHQLALNSHRVHLMRCSALIGQESLAERDVNLALLDGSMTESRARVVEEKFKRLKRARENVLQQKYKSARATDILVKAKETDSSFMVNPIDASRIHLIAHLVSSNALEASFRLRLLKAKLAQCRASAILSRGKITRNYCTEVIEELKKIAVWLSLKYEYLKYIALGENRKPLKIVSNFQIIN